MGSKLWIRYEQVLEHSRLANVDLGGQRAGTHQPEGNQLGPEFLMLETNNY